MVVSLCVSYHVDCMVTDADTSRINKRWVRSGSHMLAMITWCLVTSVIYENNIKSCYQ